MAWVCERCGKGKMHGNKVSHAKNRSKRVFKPNLQSLRVEMFGVRRKMRLCTKCVRIVRKEMKEVQEAQKAIEARRRKGKESKEKKQANKAKKKASGKK